MTPAERYTRAHERAAALQFLAASFDGVDDAEARRIRDSIHGVLTDEVTWSGKYARGPRGDASELEIEAFQHAREMGLIHSLATLPNEPNLTRTAELERMGRMPKFETPPWLLEPSIADSADDDPTAEERRALQLELEADLRDYHPTLRALRPLRPLRQLPGKNEK